MKKILEMKNVTKKFGDRKVLDDINISVESGRIVGLLGKNGAGKSTIIKLVNGLFFPTSGEIKVCGKEISEETRAVVAYLPEINFLDKTKTVEDMVKYYNDFFSDFDEEKARKLLDDLGLDVKSKIRILSKGMQEKVQLVLVMSRKAKLYILDEPLGGVDPATRDYILDTILNNFSNDASMIISTHIISDIERILDDVIIIDNGKIKYADEAENLRDKTGQSIDNFFRKEFKNA